MEKRPNTHVFDTYDKVVAQQQADQQRLADLQQETTQLQALTGSGYNTDTANVVSGDNQRKRRNLSTSLGIN